MTFFDTAVIVLGLGTVGALYAYLLRERRRIHDKPARPEIGR